MTRPTAVLTPKSRPKAATLSEARRVSGTAGAALLATSGSAIGPLSAGPRLLAQAGPAEYLAVIRRDFEQCHGAVRARDDLAARVPQGLCSGPSTVPGAAPGAGGGGPSPGSRAACHTIQRRPSSQLNAPGYGFVRARTKL